MDHHITQPNKKNDLGHSKYSWTRFLYAIQSLIAYMTIVLSVVIYSGYIFDIEYLYRPIAGGAATHELTIFTVVLIALSILLGKVAKKSLPSLILAYLAGLIALLRLVEIIFNLEIISPLTPFSSVVKAAINQGLSHEMCNGLTKVK